MNVSQFKAEFKSKTRLVLVDPNVKWCLVQYNSYIGSITGNCCFVAMIVLAKKDVFTHRLKS